jgi:hypothetical protein
MSTFSSPAVYVEPWLRGSYALFRCCLCAAIVAIPTTSCRKTPPVQVAAVLPKEQPQLSQDRVPGPDEESCRVFVQKFYDWYSNQFADKADNPKFDRRNLHSYGDPLRRQPPVLSPELIRLIKRDDARAKAAGGIANLDFDPYLNSQDPEGKYEVTRVTVNGNLCRAKLSQRDVVAEAKRDGPDWVFSNFYYSFYSEDRRKKEAPDDDLVHILSQP